jgi:hypothetical protein
MVISLVVVVNFTPATNFNGSFSISTSVTDNVAAAITGSKAVTGTAVNDAPTATNLSTAEAYTEDTALNLTDIVVTDVDSAVTATLTLSNTSAGSLTTATSGAVTSTFAAGVWTASGAVADVNTLLAGVNFIPATNFNGSFSITTSVTDNVAAAITGSKAVTGTAVNDAPTATNLSASENYTEDTTLNLANIVVSDVDSSSVTATLTLSNPAAGSLSTATSGAVTSTFIAATGVWTASGALADVNVLLAGVSFIPAANSNSSFTIATSATDGVAAAITGSKVITGTAVNDAPALAALAPLGVIEDAAEQTVDLAGIGSGAANEADTLTVTATSSDPALIPTPTVSYTSAQATGSLKFTPAAQRNGQATITVTVDDGQALNHETSRSFVVTVTTVNDPPSFTKGANQSVLEDAGPQVVTGWATALSRGPADEAGQTLSFLVSSDNPTLFASGPAIAPNGALSYTPAVDANGSATVTVQIMDDGGTANNGTDTSAAQTFSIAVTAVNDAPSFAKGADRNVLQNAGTQTVPGWATALSAGASDESAQTLNFTVTTNNDGLFSALPAISPAGTLTFTPSPAANGSTTVTVVLHDDGGTENNGVDASAPQSFVISTGAVNDPPTFTLGGNQSVPQEAGPQTVLGFATDIAPGPADEAAQTVDFQIEFDHPELFAAQPAISPTGTLTYTPAAAASGTAVVTVRLHDDGPSAAPDVNLSAAQSFKIAVTSFTEELGTYNGLSLPSAGAAPGADKTGLLKLTIAKKGKVTGKLKLGAFSHSFTGTINNAGVVSFGKTNAATATLKRKAPLTGLTLSDLRVDVGGGTDSLTGTITDGSAPFATIGADRALYTSKKNPVAPLRSVPVELQGKYTVLFDEPLAPGLAAADVPHGDGYGTLTVSKSGVAKISGKLADGSKVSYANALSKKNAWPLWVPFAKGTGALAGPVQFPETPGAPPSQFAGPGLLWFKAEKLTTDYFPNGWPAGITTDLAGSSYVVPPKDPPASVVPGLGLADGDGNAKFTLTGGDLITLDLSKALNISEKNKVLVVTEAEDKLKVTIAGATGLIKGSFVHPVSLKPVKFQGVLFQAQQFGSGFFLGPSGSGAMTLVPADNPGVP